MTKLGRPHIVEGEFQSDKYPTTPRGKVPLSTKDPTAHDLLWEYAQRRRSVDAEFADDLEWALRKHGFVPPAPRRLEAQERTYEDGLVDAAQLAFDLTEVYQHRSDGIDALDDIRGALLHRAGRNPEEQGSSLSLAERDRRRAAPLPPSDETYERMKQGVGPDGERGIQKR